MIQYRPVNQVGSSWRSLVSMHHKVFKGRLRYKNKRVPGLPRLGRFVKLPLTRPQSSLTTSPHSARYANSARRLGLQPVRARPADESDSLSPLCFVKTPTFIQEIH